MNKSEYMKEWRKRTGYVSPKRTAEEWRDYRRRKKLGLVPKPRKKMSPEEKREAYNQAMRKWNKTPNGRAYNLRRRDRVKDPLVKEYVGILMNDPCSYCNGPGGEIDHIVPVSKGGETVWDNLTAACRNCNAQKRDMSLLTFLLKRKGGGIS